MKKNFYLLLFLSLFIIAPAFSQHSWQWAIQENTATILDQETDSLGRTYVVYNMSNRDSIKINNITFYKSRSTYVFASYNRNGSFRWARQFRSSGFMSNNTYGQSTLENLTLDRQGNVYVTGAFADTLFAGQYTLVSPRNTNPMYTIPQSAAIIKLDSLGNVLWAKQSTGSDDENSTALSHTSIDKYGNIYAISSGKNACFDSYCFSSQGSRVIKYNPQGQVIGAFSISNSTGLSAFTTDQDGNLFMAGIFTGTVTIGGTTLNSGSNLSDIYIIKYGPAGNVLWVKQEGSSAAVDYRPIIATDRQGNLILTGNFRTANTTIGNTNLTIDNARIQSYIVKYNPAGQVQWVHKHNYLGTNESVVFGLSIDMWGNIFANYRTSGYYTPQGSGHNWNYLQSFLIALSPSGTVRWTEQGKWNQLGLNGGSAMNYDLSTDHGGGVYYSNRGNTEIGPYILTTANGQNFRAKLLDCDVVKATVISPLTGSLTICDNAPPVQLQARVTSGGELTYQWQRNNQNIPGATTSTYSTLQTGDYRVIVSNFNGCVDTSAAVTLNIVSQPLPTATVTAPTITEVCLGDSVQLQANTGAGYTYQWKRGNDFVSGATSATFAATQSGNYSVVVTNSSGCSQVSAPVAVTVNEPPTALISASGPTAICQNQSVTLVAPSGQGIQYQWQHNGVDISGATSIAYAASQAGDFTVRMTSAKGCSMLSNIIPVTINPAPGIIINVSGSTTICQNGAVTISTPSVNGQTYQWQRNGIDLPGQTTTSLMITQPGDYRVLVTGNANLCSNYSQITTVSIDPGPIAQITAAGPTAICPGGTVALVANSGTGYTYRWYKDNMLLPNATTSLLNVTTPGDYRVEIENSRGCFNASAPVTVTTAPLPTATIATTDPLTFCNGSSANLTATTGTGWLYQWQRNGQDIPGATNATFTATQSGDYRVLITTPAGCVATSNQLSATVIATQKPAINAASDSTICAGNSVTLFTTATGTYQWLLNGNAINAATSASVTANLAGSYQVIVSNATGCTDTSRVLNIALDSVPTATIIANGPLTFCAGDSIKLSTSANSNYNYQWYQNGMLLAGKTADSLWVTQAGNYSVQVRNARGCMSQANPVAVNLNAMPTATITQSGNILFASAGSSYQWFRNGNPINGANSQVLVADSSGSYFVTITHNGCMATSPAVTIMISGMKEELALAQINVFPNPGTSVFNITMTNGFTGPVELQLFDLIGRLLQKQVIQKEQDLLATKFSVENLPTGLYLLKINQGKKSVVQKLSIKR